MAPNKIGRYEIKAELGRGGMATVYRAYDPMFEREVALKILPQELMHDEQFRVRFQREAKTIARLEHAAIVPVYDVGQSDDGQPYFVMRNMTGGSLSDRMNGGSFSIEETARIVRRIAAALDYAHAKGIIHRDLKPGNILFDEAGDPFISDYGIAKLAQSQTNYTGSSIIGTPTYMSPEQGQGDDIDGRSDIYSLGVITYEMLSGVVPYQANTPLGVVFKHVTEPIPHILDVNPQLPVTIEPVIEKALAKDRNNRFQNAMDFAVALGALGRGEIPDLDRTSPVATHLNMQALKYAAEHAPANVAKAASKMPKSRIWLLAGSGVLILAVLIFGSTRLSGMAAQPTASVLSVTNTPDLSIVIVPSAMPSDTITPTVEPTSSPTPAGPPSIGGADGIAFLSANNIWVMGIDGNDLKQLTSDSKPKFDLQWLANEQTVVYVQEKCVFQLEVSTRKITKITCFNAKLFEGFRVSPDGKQVAISVDRQLFIVPFDLTMLASVHDRNELAAVNGCLAYQTVAAKNSLWSKDGKKLAMLFLLGGNDRRVAETVRVMDIHNCRDSDPLILDEFPGKHFIPESYKINQVLPAFSWDGGELFIFNSLKRNDGYGPLYTYDMSSQHENKIDPVGPCCYRDARFSPDGHFILFVYQDFSLGANSKTLLYYIPVEKIGTNTTFIPIKLPDSLFADPHANPQFALHFAPNVP